MKLKKISLVAKLWFHWRKRHFIKLFAKRYFHPQLAQLFFDAVWNTSFAMEQLYVAPKRVAADLPIVLVIGETKSGKSSLIAGSRQILPQSTHLNAEYQPMSGRYMPKLSASPQRLYIEVPQYFLVNESAKKIPYLEQLLLAWDATGERNKIHQVILTLSLETLSSKPLLEEFWDAVSLLLEKLPKPVNVYLVITQMDRLQGFTEYFSDLSVEERQHPFGFMLVGKKSLSEQLPAHFQALAQRLKRRMWWRCQSEHLLSRRLLVAEFPQQFSTLTRQLMQYLSDFFNEAQQNPHVQLRACFFTSTMQQGSMVDLLFDQQDTLFTLREEPSNLPMLIQNKEYFVRGFFQQLLFGVSRASSKEGKFHWPSFKFGASILSILFAVGILCAGFWGWEWWTIDQALSHQKSLAYKILSSPYADQNLQQFVAFETPYLPQVLQNSLAQSQTVHAWVNENAKDFLNARWQKEVVSFYSQYLAGKYPLNSAATQEVDVAKFDAFYGPQGILANYDQHYLQSPNVQKLFINDKIFLDVYSNVKFLQSILYRNTAQSHLAFTAYPQDLAGSIRSASFMVAGTKMNVRRNSLIAQTFAWPNEEPIQESGFSVEYLETLPSLQVFQGTWSWLTLFKTLHWQKEDSGNDYQVSMPNHEFMLSIEAETPIAELPNLFDHLVIPKNI